MADVVFHLVADMDVYFLSIGLMRVHACEVVDREYLSVSAMYLRLLISQMSWRIWKSYPPWLL